MTREVTVVRTGSANLASVVAALGRAGRTPGLVDDAGAVARAERLVLPGVGAFGAVMARLVELGLVEALTERIAAGRPTLAICLGLQVLAEGSEESPGVAGLGVVPGRVTRLPGGVVVPQLGWNRVEADPGCRLLVRRRRLLRELVQARLRARRLVGRVERPRRTIRGRPRARGGARVPVPPRAVRGLGRGPARALAGGVAVLMRRVIPCLDVDGGRVVKGVRFQGLRDAGDPVERAAVYAGQGADELVLLDVSATPEGRGHALATVAAVRRVLPIPLTVGGGVREVSDAAALLEAGADKVGVNTAAVARPRLLEELASRFGCQCTVLALDAARRSSGWEVMVRSGRERAERDAVEWAREAAGRGAGEILLTSWDRDGTGEGYDLELIAAIADAVTVPIVASGGARTPEHMAAALAAGADAVLAASILHDGHTTVAELKARLQALGAEVRR